MLWEGLHERLVQKRLRNVVDHSGSCEPTAALAPRNNEESAHNIEC